ncbi:MAG: PAS domain-containing sensor histidine kinase [Ignavibacteria bacterium]|nr:PAS domain-containing sensor histidine kinase [Ignavibacteria bacterium]
MDVLQLDLRTIVFLLFAGNITSAVVLFAYKASELHGRAYKTFMHGKLLQGIAWLLLSFRGGIPDLLSVYLGNSLLIFGFCFEALAINAVPNYRENREKVLIGIAVTSVVGFDIFANTPGLRVSIASLITCIFFFIAGLKLLYRGKESALHATIGILYFGNGLIHFIRSATYFLAPESITLLSPGLVQTLSFLAAYILVFTSTIGFLLIIKKYDDEVLRTSEIKFSKVFHLSPSAVALTEFESGKVVEVNRVFEEITGFTSPELEGKSFVELGIWGSAEGRANVMKKVALNGSITNFEYPFYNKAGETVIGLFSAVIIEVNGKKLLVSVTNDITERYKDAERAAQNARDLQAANRTKDTLFSIISHDLRGPFHPILNLSEMLNANLTTLQPDEIKMFAASIYSNSQKVYDLLQNLLEWSRMQKGQMKFAPNDIHLLTVVEQVLSVLNQNALEKTIQFITSIEKDIYVYADEHMLRSILHNLVNNAIKFTGENGQVIINASVSEGQTIVSVTDTGVGISPEHIQKILSPDEFITTIGTFNEKGTGLGLMLCKDFITKHQGTFTINSEEGKGTQITVTFPNIPGSII